MTPIITKMPATLFTDTTIVVNYSGQTHALVRQSPAGVKLEEAIRTKNFQDIPSIVDASKRVETGSGGLFTVKDGQVFVGGVKAPAALGRKISEFAEQGLPYEPLVKFTENLQLNPSYRAVNELYEFLEKNNHPITEDGHFIAYKKVAPNFHDLHTGTIDNSPGRAPSVSRNEVDENPTRTCSKGLHVANWDYAANSYGSPNDPMLEVKVHPRDVVAVPNDYNQAKMRTCGYEVLGVVEQELSTPLRVVDPSYNNTMYGGQDPNKTHTYPCENNGDSEHTEKDVELCYECGEQLSEDDIIAGYDNCYKCDDKFNQEEYCNNCEEYHDSNYPCEEDHKPFCNDCSTHHFTETEDCEDTDEEETDEDEGYPWDEELD
jgi:hypothetical protein